MAPPTPSRDADRGGHGTDRGDATRRHILEVAAGAFAEHGYAGTSLNDVIRAAGVTKGGFYHHFPSKESLALQVVRYKQDQWAGRVMASAMRQTRAVDQLRAMPEALVDLHEEDHSTESLGKLCMELSENRDLAPELMGQFITWIDLTSALVAKAQQEGDIRPDVDPGMAGELAVCAFVGLEELSRSVSGSTDLRERVRRVFDVLFTLFRPTEAANH